MRNAIFIAVLTLFAALPAAAQRNAGAPDGAAASIYSCVDDRGRTITADRLIAACMDREQFELSPGGTVRRRIEPAYTAAEQAAREERARQAEQQALRLREERRQERALLVRYPNLAAHERERADALGQVDAVSQAARKRLAELADERKRIDEELEFYKGDASKAPDSIRRQLDDNAQSAAVQIRFIQEQDAEKKRIDARFDEERTRLSKLWAPADGGSVASPSANSTSPASPSRAR